MIKQWIKSAVSRTANLFGVEVCIYRTGKSAVTAVDQNSWEPYFHPNERMQLYFEGLKKSGNEWSDNFNKRLRFYSLLEMASYARKHKLEGDFVECGVWKGHSAYMISKLLVDSQFKGGFHIFDSFEGGLSPKTTEDKNLVRELSKEQISKESAIFSSTEEEVRACLAEFPFVHLYKGWIPERFHEVKDKKFAFVHIDVDLFEPTRDSLNFFYPRLVDNGVIVCDDYGATQFPGAKKAVDQFLAEHPHKLFYEVPMGACFIIK